ncbi:MAG: hypothetical protein WC989_07410 [Micavibrio sp.]
MSEAALQTALNVLSLLEEESPRESERLRRLLPALALDFARAGVYPSEKDFLAIIEDARKNGHPIHSLFLNKRHNNAPALSYKDIVGRLNKWHRLTNYFDDIESFGKTAEFIQHETSFGWNSDKYEAAAITAAGKGHTGFMLYMLSHLNFNKKTIYKTLETALKTRQYHIYEQLVEDFGNPPNGGGAMRLSSARGREYQAYSNLCSDFRKSYGHGFDPEWLIGLENVNVRLLKLRPYLEIREFFGKEIGNLRQRNEQSYKAAVLFQSPDRALRMLNNWGAAGSTPLHDILKHIEITNYTADTDWPSWGDALLKYGPEMYYPVHFANRIKAPSLNEMGLISLRKTYNDIWRDVFSGRNGNTGQISELGYMYKIKQKALKKAFNLWGKAPVSPKLHEAVPPLEMDCARIGLSGYKLQKLDYNDPRILFLGYYTGCCEKIGDHFEETIEHALTTRASGFYVLTKDGEIAAHSWAWRGENKELVIDGWESNDGNINTNLLRRLVNEMAYMIDTPAFDNFRISDILIGISGKDFHPQASFDPAENPPTRFACKWYYADQKPALWLVHKIKTPEQRAKSQLGYAPALKPWPPQH